MKFVVNLRAKFHKTTKQPNAACMVSKIQDLHCHILTFIDLHTLLLVCQFVNKQWNENAHNPASVKYLNFQDIYNKKKQETISCIKRFRHVETFKISFLKSSENKVKLKLFKQLIHFNKIKHLYITAICFNSNIMLKIMSPLCKIVAMNSHQIRTLDISYRWRSEDDKIDSKYPILFGIIDNNNKNPLLKMPQMQNKQILYPNLRRVFLRLWEIPLSQTLMINQGCLQHLDFSGVQLTLEFWKQACKSTDKMFNNVRSLTLDGLELETFHKLPKYDENERNTLKYKIFPLIGRKLLKLESFYLDLHDTDLYLHLLYHISNAHAESQSKKLKNLKLDFGYGCTRKKK